MYRHKLKPLEEQDDADSYVGGLLRTFTSLMMLPTVRETGRLIGDALDTLFDSTLNTKLRC